MYDLEDYEKRTPNFPDRSLANKIQDLETRDFIPGIGFASSLNDLQDMDFRLNFNFSTKIGSESIGDNFEKDNTVTNIVDKRIVDKK